MNIFICKFMLICYLYYCTFSSDFVLCQDLSIEIKPDIYLLVQISHIMSKDILTCIKISGLIFMLDAQHRHVSKCTIDFSWMGFYFFVHSKGLLLVQQQHRHCSSTPLTWQNSVCCRKVCQKGWAKLPLLLVSMDGFRADYLKRDKTPSIQSLLDCGTHAPFLYPSYPTKTFPNHYTIITGLYPESHGIIDNVMYDATVEPEKDRFFSRPEPSAKNPVWWGGEPFWNTVTKNGMKSATFFWPGTEARIQNMTPTYFYNYNSSVPFYQRVDQIITWLLMSDSERPDFITMYFDEPDHTGHLFGPDSSQITNELVRVDAFINYLLRKIFENDLLHCVNFVLLADHGMQTIYKEPLKLTDYVSNVEGLLVFEGAMGRIMLGNSTLMVDNLMQDLMCKYDKARFYKIEDVPKRFHYSKRRERQGDIIVDMDAGYMFYNNTPWKGANGDHGFDYKYDSMHALFIAYGPKFKQNYTIKPFQNVELYNLFADTLEIPLVGRAPNNGTVGALHPLFVKPPEKPLPSQVLPLPICDFNLKSLKRCGYCSNNIQNGFKSCNPNDYYDNPVMVKSPCLWPTCVSPMCQAPYTDFHLIYWNHLDTPIALKYFIDRKSASLEYSNNLCTIVLSDENCPDLWAFNAINASLYSLNLFQKETASFSRTKVTMYNKFYNGPWTLLQNLTLQYLKKYNQLFVISGAIFDYNADGLADSSDIIDRNGAKLSLNVPTIATHFYQILMRCDGGQGWVGDGGQRSCHGVPYAMSFIFPHKENIDNCLSPDKYLRLHTGRVSDIELLTGLQFFNYMDTSTSVQLRTYINEHLWPL